jgi:hypothetical protein
VQEQDDRVLAILTANTDPLLDAADIREELFINAFHWVDRRRGGDLMMTVGPISETGGHRHENDDQNPG